MKNPFKRQPDPFAASRYEGMFRGARTRQRRKPWLLRHRWAWVSLIVLILIGAGAGYAAYQYFSLQGDLQEDIDNVKEADEGEPFNVLLVGSDSREGLTEEEKLSFGADDEGVTGERADTLILAHIDPAENHVTMVQFPRDLYVPLSTGEENKINAALETGKKALVQTVQDLTGLEINRYAQVNIAGFREVVDAIGGVDICITEPVPFDKQTGIEITQEEIDESPLVHFDGERALRFVRSRNFPNGDFGRIQNQQRFLSAALNKVTSIGTLMSPGRIGKLMAAARKNVKIDSGTDLTELRATLNRFRSFDPENYEAYTAPNLGLGWAGDASIVVADFETMEVMFDAIARNESPAEADNAPDIDVTTVNVGVYNGTFEEGIASAAADKLKAAITVGGDSVNIADIANADRSNYKGVVVRYDPEALDIEAKVELLEAALPTARFKEVDQTFVGVDIEVIVGKGRFAPEKVVQIKALPLPEPGEVPADCD
jgi:LCP family protein required for cell wall assembly